uniref:Uncharacterized protein n=1 Tax=Rhizophora mucronata TaxID=61149 RepID=A0A2P2NG23_RHIMU
MMQIICHIFGSHYCILPYQQTEISGLEPYHFNFSNCNKCQEFLLPPVS